MCNIIPSRQQKKKGKRKEHKTKNMGRRFIVIRRRMRGAPAVRRTVPRVRIIRSSGTVNIVRRVHISNYQRPAVRHVSTSASVASAQRAHRQLKQMSTSITQMVQHMSSSDNGHGADQKHSARSKPTAMSDEEITICPSMLVEQVKYQLLEQRMTEQSNALKKYQTQADIAKETNSQLQASLNKTKTQYDQLRANYTDLQNLHDKQQEELVAVRTSLESQSDALDDTKESMSQLLNENKLLRQEQVHLKSTLKTLSTEIKELHDIITKQQSSIADLLDTLRSERAEKNVFKRLLEDAYAVERNGAKMDTSSVKSMDTTLSAAMSKLIIDPAAVGETKCTGSSQCMDTVNSAMIDTSFLDRQSIASTASKTDMPPAPHVPHTGHAVQSDAESDSPVLLEAPGDEIIVGR